MYEYVVMSNGGKYGVGSEAESSAKGLLERRSVDVETFFTTSCYFVKFGYKLLILRLFL